MPRFIEKVKSNIKKLPAMVARRLVSITLIGDFLEITFPSLTQSRNVKELLEDLTIDVNRVRVYDFQLYPNDFDVRLNGILYPNQYLSQIHTKLLKIGDKLTVIVPNRADITVGNYFIEIGTHSAGPKTRFSVEVSPYTEKALKEIEKKPAQKQVHRQCDYCGKIITDPNQKICEDCGSEL